MTRTDDSHAIPKITKSISLKILTTNLISNRLVITLVRFCVDYRIKPHVPPFYKVPANSVKFQPCDCTTQAGCLYVSLLLYNTHLLLCGLLGSQILIGNRTFMVQLSKMLFPTFVLIEITNF